ncbi:hypothetical protein DAPPUDRAFT_121389 [Daphnia pulex]|uniref:Uncharacterized protein n=1 Tax=Daphnia pulex TaxID=6669 RepID=E9I338_DAPPU|nr:hypothetical protein DAPPUDRAFT_121389 [Daphnia pulex]|eukprot:EFX61592.1 hypothetical protein DAPPUDRAFT_121389 [Daphnia pulex]
MYERECWSIHYFRVRGTIDRWRRLTIPYSRPPFLHIKLLFSIISLTGYSFFFSDHARERFSLDHALIFFSVFCASRLPEWKWSPRDDVVAEEVNDDDSIAELERSFAASTIDLTMDEDVNLLEEDEGRKVKRLSEEGAEPTGSKRQKLE